MMKDDVDSSIRGSKMEKDPESQTMPWVIKEVDDVEENYDMKLWYPLFREK